MGTTRQDLLWIIFTRERSIINTFRGLWAESGISRLGDIRGFPGKIMDSQLHWRVFYIDFTPLRAFPYLTMNTSGPCAFRLRNYRQYNEIVSWAKGCDEKFKPGTDSPSEFSHRPTNGPTTIVETMKIMVMGTHLWKQIIIVDPKLLVHFPKQKTKKSKKKKNPSAIKLDTTLWDTRRDFKPGVSSQKLFSDNNQPLFTLRPKVLHFFFLKKQAERWTPTITYITSPLAPYT